MFSSVVPTFYNNQPCFAIAIAFCRNYDSICNKQIGECSENPLICYKKGAIFCIKFFALNFFVLN